MLIDFNLERSYIRTFLCQVRGAVMDVNLEIGELAPDFSLIATDGMIYNLTQYRGSRAIALMFTNNHSLFDLRYEEYFSSLFERYHQKGVVFIAINPENDTHDIYDEMVAKMQTKKNRWPYLHDSTQTVAGQYGAITSPHFYLLDHNRYLIYSGRAMEDIKNESSTIDDKLKIALDEYLDSRPITEPRTEPVGKSLKIHQTV